MRHACFKIFAFPGGGTAEECCCCSRTSKKTVETEDMVAENVNADKKQCRKCFKWYSRSNRHMSGTKSCKE